MSSNFWFTSSSIRECLPRPALYQFQRSSYYSRTHHYGMLYIHPNSGQHLLPCTCTSSFFLYANQHRVFFRHSSIIRCAVVAAAASLMDHCDGAEKKTRSDHCSHRNTGLLRSYRDSSSWTERTRRRRRRSRPNGEQRRCFIIDIVVVLCLSCFLVRHDFLLLFVVGVAGFMILLL